MDITQLNVLIVDDSSMILSLLEAQLIKMNAKSVSTATNGKEAWQKVQESKESGNGFDLIISDYNMPEMTGKDLFLKLKSSSLEIKFIIMTATAENSAILELISRGVDSYFTKPIKIEELMEKIAAL